MVTKLALFLISPLGASLALGLLAMVFVALRKRRLSAILGALALIWLFFWSLPLCSSLICRRLESEFPPTPVQDLPEAQAIVVLGGAISGSNSWRPFPDLSDSADRIWHAARLYHAGKAPLVVLSGGSNPASGVRPEAEAMQVFLHDLGVPDSAMLLEKRSLSTYENARFTAALLRKRGIDRILLVTSALHMHRALAHFEEEGLHVIPAATDYAGVEGPFGLTDFLPNAAALDGNQRAIKELLGRWKLARETDQKLW
jgi:uncharacterized SAM-binding protein YcdF (DUF218 family)